ncbi:MAG: histidinol-phosphatase HisJ family protein [Acutalibacteraceae bacterium]|nr:histidinol-phosphatase HisJ family protein [Acutalibacteraceae bacterium]
MSYDFEFICDCHTHSKWSFDGCEKIDDMCEQAVKLGINVLTITDHCEVNGWNTPNDSEFGDFSKLIPESIKHLKESQIKYADNLKLLSGIELGQAMQDLKSADIALSLDDFDFVLASVHNVRNEKDFYWLEYTPESAKDLLYTYFNEVLEVVKWNKFDSLSHLTYPLRYITGVHKINIDINEYLPIIDKIFNKLIKNGKALEVNTSGLRQEIGVTMPDKFLLTRYYSLGGRLVTIGSDAHKVVDLGKGINKTLHLLKKIGFDNYYYFEKHNPVAVPIKII